MSMGSAVYTPWPISALSQKKVMLLSVPMRSHALGSTNFVSPLAPAFGEGLHAGRLMAMTRPPTNARRENVGFADMQVSSPETLCLDRTLAGRMVSRWNYAWPDLISAARRMAARMR